MFDLTTNLKPKGDQGNAINKILENFKNGKKQQVLLGATGTGKTFTIANIITSLKKKTLVIVHNKVLAAQLYQEFKDLFKNSHVEYFVSYFDFYRPEAYIPSKDIYIEKSSQANQDIELLRLSTINSLASEKDTIVIASVAAIYASISPQDYETFRIVVAKNTKRDIKQLIYELVKLQYERNDIEQLKPGTFKLNGDVLEIFCGNNDQYKIRISFFGDTIEDIAKIDPLENKVIEKLNIFVISPAKEYVMNEQRKEEAIKRIRQELAQRASFFRTNNKLVEEQRITERVNHDIESINELGYCSGIENYSRHLELRKEGETPWTIFDFFDKKDWLLVVDESHMTIDQIHGMYEGDRSRKTTLVEYGFRLPSALDNRPLNFKEFESKLDKVIYVSATPNNYEISKSENNVVEQIIRPTGLLDPIIEIKPTKEQILDLINEVKKVNKKGEKVLITVLTISMAEELSNHLNNKGIKCVFMHHEINTIERAVIINDLRKGKYDALIGINLLREGLDIPEVSLVVMIDADKEGLFRNKKSLIQTFGRAARNANGRVILYADKMTLSMKEAIAETKRRREIQQAYNLANNITPQTIKKEVRDNIVSDKEIKVREAYIKNKPFEKKEETIKRLRIEMEKAANRRDYESAIELRDLIIELEGEKSNLI